MRTVRLAALVVLALSLGACAPRKSEAQVTWNSATVSWTAPGDDSLSGTAAQYDLRYSTSAITAANFAAAPRWIGTPSPAAPGTRQTATVLGLQPTTTYWFAIKTADEVPNWSGISNIITRTTLAAPDTIPPAAIRDLGILQLPALLLPRQVIVRQKG